MSNHFASLVLVMAPIAGLTFWGLHSATAVPSTPEPRTCTAAVLAFEDGSWMGGPLVLDGTVIATRWEVAGPDLQGQVIDGVAYTAFTPGWDGIECRMQFGPW